MADRAGKVAQGLSQTLINVRIVGNKFYSKETEGDFVTFISEGKKNYGLRIGKPWSGSVEKG